MRKGMYFKLAISNIKTYKRLYLPYLLACIACATVFYIMLFLQSNSRFLGVGAGATLSVVLAMGAIVIGIFSFAIMLYSNNFLMRQRKKEIGLYNILGMEKRHISGILFIESIITVVITIVLGILCGTLFSKLAELILCKLLGLTARLGFSFSPVAAIATCILFLCIFGFSLIKNMGQVHFTKPIDLLHAADMGDKEPKTKWLTTIFGLITLGSGYAMAVLTKNPAAAIGVFFIAVILVIIGTFCVFSAGSITMLKILRNNKRYYYNKKHFSVVSGMLHRMKQNAAGLANICILSTMVLVMLSSTVCLFSGLDEAVRNEHPRNIMISAYGIDENEYSELEAYISKTVKATDVATKNELAYRYNNFYLVRTGKSYDVQKQNEVMKEQLVVYLMSLSDYNKAAATEKKLSVNEVLLYTNDSEFNEQSISVCGKDYKVTEKLSDFPITGTYSFMRKKVCYIVFSDISEVNSISTVIKQAIGYDNAEESGLSYFYGIDVPEGSEKELKLYNQLQGDELKNAYLANSVGIRDTYISLYGGLFFLGVFLSILFIMATVLIMYYKQISEGYDDQRRYSIMQQVGMSDSDVKVSIKSQVLTVFFLPLIVTAIHLAFAFPLLSCMFRIFSITNTSVFLLCIGISFIIFSGLYLLAYVLTARTYYRIVRFK